MVSPLGATNGDQLVASFEVRVSNETAVPAGMLVCASSVDHCTLAPAFIGRDTNGQLETNGDICSQSTERGFGLTVRSLTPGLSGWVIATFCVSTTLPSIENTTLEGSQSIRNRCCVPSQFPGIGSS